MFSQRMKIRNAARILCACAIIVLCGIQPVTAQPKGEIKVTVQPNQGIRDIAREYLKDADLWEEILRSNNLRTPADVKPGMPLTIPVTQILRAKKAVDEALAEIQKATQAGAKTFAAKLIDNAVKTYDQSVKERKLTHWEKSFQLAAQAKQEANNAYQEAVSKSSPPGEASVSYAKGKVEGKRSSENLWRPAPPPSRLAENDRIRTSASSFAEVLFQDKSKIRLSENALAIIQRNRMDLLKNTGETKVTLEKGDAFAVLFGSPNKKKFKLEVPGLETNVKSKSFWVNREEKTTKIANYDGELELKARGGMVTLKQNQGSSLLATGNLTQPKDLLKAPGLLSPQNESVIYSGDFKLEWKPVPLASKYWLIIAKDATFKAVVEQWKDVPQTSRGHQLEKGVYFWKVAGVDAEGFPGVFSESRSFTLIVDNDPPYIAVSQPKDSSIVNTADIEVKGMTESGVAISLQGKQLETDADGAFGGSVRLSQGENIVVIEGIDKNGNKTQIKRTVTFAPGKEINLLFEPPVPFTGRNELYSPTASITVKGKTSPLAFITAMVEPGMQKLKVLADSAGGFLLSFKDIEDRIDVTVTAESKEGTKTTERMTIYRDGGLPEISFREELPGITADRDLIILGAAKNVARLLLNGENLDVREAKFQTVFPLKEGKNILSFRALNNKSAQTTVTREVVLDSKPPELVSQKVTTVKEKEQGSFIFEVKAKDATDLKKSAKIVYQADEEMYTEYLRLDAVESVYRGSAYFSGKAPVIKIRMILLEDQMNNSKEYNFFE